MPQFYYQIKGHKPAGEYTDAEWVWPPVFSGLVEAPTKKEAKILIEEEYGRQFPIRVLRKDIEQHAYLLNVRELGPEDEYLLRRFRDTPCKVCGAIFKLIDKYNDTHADKSPDYCSESCKAAGKYRDLSEFRLASEGKVPPVIYQVRQKSTGMVYVGQTTQPFTLRWWQHLSNPSECKFHVALKQFNVTDWEFSVLETIEYPADCADRAKWITDRERHWIEDRNSVAAGYNTIRPSGITPQQHLEKEPAQLVAVEGAK